MAQSKGIISRQKLSKLTHLSTETPTESPSEPDPAIPVQCDFFDCNNQAAANSEQCLYRDHNETLKKFIRISPVRRIRLL